MANGIEIGVTGHEDVLMHGVRAAKGLARAHHLRSVEALSKRTLLLQMGEKLAASIRDICGNGQTKAG